MSIFSEFELSTFRQFRIRLLGISSDFKTYQMLSKALLTESYLQSIEVGPEKVSQILNCKQIIGPLEIQISFQFIPTSPTLLPVFSSSQPRLLSFSHSYAHVHASIRMLYVYKCSFGEVSQTRVALFDQILNQRAL